MHAVIIVSGCGRYIFLLLQACMAKSYFMLILIMDNIDYVTGIGNRSCNTDRVCNDARYLE